MKYNLDLVKEQLSDTTVTLKTVCSKLGYPYKYISRLLKSEGIDNSFRSYQNKFDERVFLKMYQEYKAGATIEALAKKYKYNNNTIRKYFFNVLQLQKINNSKFCVSLNHDFFKNIDTEEKAYLLGFFAADGTLNRADNGMVILIQAEDIEILEYYKNAFNDTKEFYKYPAKKATHKDRLKCVISSRINKENLLNLGFPYRKTYNMFPLPNKIMREDLVRHFIRGYFDGDGSIVTPTKNSRNTAFKMVSSNVDFLEYVKSILVLLGCYNINIEPAGGIAKVIVVKNKPSINLIYKYLYENCQYYLNRKYIKMKNVALSLSN